MVRDPSHTVALMGSRIDVRSLRALLATCCVVMSGIGAAALVWSTTPTTATGPVVTAAVVAASTAMGAVVIRRAHDDPLLCVPLSLVAVIFSWTTGFLAVPAGPHVAHVLLASAAAFSAATILLRLMGCGTICLTAIATATMLGSIVAISSVSWRLPPDAGGALLGLISLAMLAAAPRVSMALTGAKPATPSADETGDPDIDDVAERAVLTHRTLTGLVTGASACAAIGAAVAAFGELRGGGSSLTAMALPTAIGLVLVLRTRTYADSLRRIILAVSGMLCAAVCVAVCVMSIAAHAHWVSLLAVAIGVTALSPLLGVTVSPVVRRATEIFDCLAIAAVAPAACWVAGLFGFVRGMNLI
jgi:type VII secretion integral membrane protein EccD